MVALIKSLWTEQFGDGVRLDGPSWCRTHDHAASSCGLAGGVGVNGGGGGEVVGAEGAPLHDGHVERGEVGRVGGVEADDVLEGGHEAGAGELETDCEPVGSVVDVLLGGLHAGHHAVDAHLEDVVADGAVARQHRVRQHIYRHTQVNFAVQQHVVLQDYLQP
jgi:hypothetical protein